MLCKAVTASRPVTIHQHKVDPIYLFCPPSTHFPFGNNYSGFVLLFIPRVNEIVRCLSFSNISLSTTPSKAIYVVKNGRISSLIWVNSLPLWDICRLLLCCTQTWLTPCNFMDCSRRAPLSMGFPRQEHCSGLPFPAPEDLPDPGISDQHLFGILD